EADRLAGEPRDQKGDDVSGGLRIPPERRKVRPVLPEETLERLDLAVARAREQERGERDVAGVVAAATPAGVDPLAARDADGERLKSALEDRLVHEDPRRNRHTDAARCEIRGDREGRLLRVDEGI